MHDLHNLLNALIISLLLTFRKSKNVIKTCVLATPTASEQSALICIANCFYFFLNFFLFFLKLFIMPLKDIFADNIGAFSNKEFHEQNYGRYILVSLFIVLNSFCSV